MNIIKVLPIKFIIHFLIILNLKAIQHFLILAKYLQYLRKLLLQSLFLIQKIFQINYKGMLALLFRLNGKLSNKNLIISLLMNNQQHIMLQFNESIQIKTMNNQNNQFQLIIIVLKYVKSMQQPLQHQLNRLMNQFYNQQILMQNNQVYFSLKLFQKFKSKDQIQKILLIFIRNFRLMMMEQRFYQELIYLIQLKIAQCLFFHLVVQL
eukprot:TRINITY_DN9999_c0_g1_i2.p1 TRINITY_DN9999_c0_g1~~TRINITY_DN9999_c0_g1_i2.p1  ORF type:complete len:208 (+),score=3.83 TRINITY_DN9999_c0_g1_i2:2-625(+)